MHIAPLKHALLIASALTTLAAPSSAVTWTDLEELNISGVPTLQSGVDDLVAGVIEWNAQFGNTAIVTGGYYLGPIADEATRQRAVDFITALDYTATGDFADPSSVSLAQISTDPAISDAARARWARAIDDAIKIGQDAYWLEWSSSQYGSIGTVAIVDPVAMVWDNILSSASYVEDLSPGIAASTGALNLRITWLWGSTRGRITADVKAICDGEQVLCMETCDAWMSLGSATVNCQVEKDGNCCVMSYSYGWGTPLVDVEVQGDGFTVKASGIGSSGDGNGTVIDCCR